MYISMIEYIYIDMSIYYYTHINTTLTTHGRGIGNVGLSEYIGKPTDRQSPPSPTTISPSGCGSIAVRRGIN